MSSESLFGGTYSDLSPGTQQLLDAVFGDTVGGVVQTTNLGSGTLITGTGAGGVMQGAVVSASGQAVVGEIAGDNLTLSIALPANVQLAFEGPAGAVSADVANTYLSNLVNAAFPSTSTDPGVAQARASLVAAIDALTQSLTGGSTPGSVTLRIVAFTESGGSSNVRAVGSNEVLFEANSQAGTSELLTFLTAALGNKTLVLKNVKAALIAGDATVRVDNAEGSFVSGDVTNQRITGGVGNDTLVGGGGNDTLTGGNGNDVFGVNLLAGNLTITDFNVAHDKLAFTVPGISNLSDLAPHFTGLTVDQADSSTLHFGSAMSITLVGVSAEQLTVDLLKFSV